MAYVIGSVGALITTFLVIPIVAWLSKKLSRRFIIGYVLWFLMIPGKPYMFLFALPFHSFGIGGLFTIMMSMTSDVLDIDELNTKRRKVYSELLPVDGEARLRLCRCFSGLKPW